MGISWSLLAGIHPRDSEVAGMTQILKQIELLRRCAFSCHALVMLLVSHRCYIELLQLVVWGKIHVINFDSLACAQQTNDALQFTLHNGILGGHVVTMNLCY